MKIYHLILGILLAFFSAAVFAEPAYNIIIDAGSSGSRIYLFEYEQAKPVPMVQTIFSENTRPGLSSFANQPTAAGQSLKILLDDAAQFMKKNYPSVDLRSVKVNVLATAGMRLLPADKQKAIYANVTDLISNAHQCAFSVGKIETITGKMEGLFGWLDVNYLLETFQRNKPTVGSIDMGGASSQIAFAVHDHSRPEDEIDLTINGKPYTVFSVSFLGLGNDQAYDAMTMSPSAGSCYPTNYTAKNKFNAQSCSIVFSSMIKKIISRPVISTRGQHFIAYSGIYYSYHFFKPETLDQDVYDAKIKAICSQDWTVFKDKYHSAQNFSGLCATAVYYNQLIYGTYKIQGHQLTITNKINQKDISWAFGAVIYDLISSSRFLT